MLTAIGWGVTDINDFTFPVPSVLHEASMRGIGSSQGDALLGNVGGNAMCSQHCCQQTSHDAQPWWLLAQIERSLLASLFQSCRAPPQQVNI